MVDYETEDLSEQFQERAYSEAEIANLILSTRYSLSKKIEIQKVRMPNGKIKLKILQKPTKYKEILTTDFTSAFVEHRMMSYLHQIETLMAQLKFLAESTRLQDDEGITHELDLSPVYNMLADIHQCIVVSSKGTGTAARTAKSQYVHTDTRQFLSQPNREPTPKGAIASLREAFGIK